MTIQTLCLDGPWAGKPICHEVDDHEARTVTSNNKIGRDRGYSVFHGVYEWTPAGWVFHEGFPVVGR